MSEHQPLQSLIDALDALEDSVPYYMGNSPPTIICEPELYERLYMIAVGKGRINGQIAIQPMATQRVRRAFGWGRLTIEVSQAE